MLVSCFSCYYVIVCFISDGLYWWLIYGDTSKSVTLTLLRDECVEELYGIEWLLTLCHTLVSASLLLFHTYAK